MSLLIGLIDQAIDPSDNVSWSDSKIGGQPVWITNSKSSTAAQRCPGCSMTLTLVVQLYCPLSNSAYHRCLYVFVCTLPGCPQYNSWRVYRGMQYDKTYAASTSKGNKQTSPKLFDNDMWTDGQDDWGDDDDDDWGDDSVSDNDEMGDDGSLDDDGGGGGGGDDLTTSHDADRQSCNEILSPTSDPTQQLPSVDKRDCRVPETVGVFVPSGESATVVQPPDVDVESPSHSVTDEDLSACFATMDVEEGSRNKTTSLLGGGSGDALMEDLTVPDTRRLDQLATVLNTKYKDSQVPAPAQQTSSRQPVSLKPYYLSVVEGTSQPSHNALQDGHIASLIRDYEAAEGKQIKEIISDRCQAKGKGGASEGYEKSNVKHGDKVFHKFWKEIQKFPEQCIRYERLGQPLLVQCLNPVQSVIPPCSNCGSGRVFELQLVPALIPWLLSPQDNHSDIEFGTVLVYTCNKSCPPSSSTDLDLIEEHVIFQQDPDHHLYR